MTKTLILVGGEEQYHDVLYAGETIQKGLIEYDILAEYSQDFNILTEPERLKPYDVLLFYTQDRNITPEAITGLKQYIEKGNGFIPIHSANVDNYDQNEEYIEIVGSKFSHHNPFHRFEVEFDNNHFITEEMENFKIDDELYQTDMINEPDQVLARAEEEGVKHPMVYTKKMGKGKICYLALGHDGRAWNHPQFKKLLYRTVIWAAK